MKYAHKLSNILPSYQLLNQLLKPHLMTILKSRFLIQLQIYITFLEATNIDNPFQSSCNSNPIIHTWAFWNIEDGF